MSFLSQILLGTAIAFAVQVICGSFHWPRTATFALSILVTYMLLLLTEIALVAGRTLGHS